MKKLFCTLSICLTLALLLASCGNNAEHEHTFGDWETTKNPTCTENGEKDRFCSCGEKQTVFIAEKGHNYVDGVCDACGGDEVAPCEHKNLEVISGIAPECDKSGLTEGIKCKDCQFVIVEQVEISKLPHTYTDDFDANCNKCGFERDVNCGHFEVDVLSAREVNCTVDGLTEGKVCKKCEEILQEQTVIPATGHTEVVDDAIPATCTKAGMTEGKHCSVCKVVTVAQSYTKALGHNEGDWIVETVPTETQDGYKYKFCSRCETKTAGEIIPFIGNLGLDYKVNSDGTTCTVTGIGNFKGSELVISEYIKEYKVTAIGERAFENCTQLTKLVIPETTIAIGTRAFYGCTGLTEFTIPKNVKTFGTQIFYKASNLKTINYKSNYSPSDGNNIFSLSHIENIIFEGTKIPSGILKNHQNIKTVTIANSVKLIEKDAFYKCNGISEVYFTGTITEWCEIQFKISSTVNNEPQVESNPIKFTDKFYIQNQLVDSVTLDCSINDYAFAGYLGLTNVVIGEKSKDVGKFVFYDCINLKTVDIRNGLTYLNDDMFWGCENLESITIPKSITTIKGTPFVLCEKLTSVYISDIEAWCNITNTVTDVYGMIPWDYSEVAKLYLNGDLITELIIPDTVTTIKRNRFSHCVYIEKIVIPDSVSNIGIAAFEGCNSLKYLVILDGVTGIEARAFGGCTNLTEVSLPESITNIAGSAFQGCTALESIIVENNFTYHSSGNCLIHTETKTLVLGCKNSVIPQDGTVTSIGEYAFYKCSNLTSIIIPNSVTSIGNYAFAYCDSLLSIFIPQSVVTIGHPAFYNYNCPNMTIWCQVSSKPAGWDSYWNDRYPYDAVVVWGYSE